MRAGRDDLLSCPCAARWVVGGEEEEQAVSVAGEIVIGVTTARPLFGLLVGPGYYGRARVTSSEGPSLFLVARQPSN